MTIYQAGEQKLTETLTGDWQDGTVQRADGSFLGIDSHYGSGPKLDWVICGGESGPGARPMENAWAQSIVDQCRAAGVPVFVKQLSAGVRANHDIETFPEGLRVREIPHAR